MMNTDRPLTNAEVALLGLLTEGDSHAWQLQKDIEFRDMRSWTELSQSTIYKQLRSLEAAGLVTCTEAVIEGRARKTYSITDEGRAALVDALLGMLSEPEHPTSRIDLATYNFAEIPRADALAALEAYTAAVRQRIECWGELDAYLLSAGCPEYRRAVARRPIRMLEGELVWLEEFTRELENR